MSEISRSTISIRIFGKSLNPDWLTAQLGCCPTEAGKTGDMIINKQGINRRVKEGFWRLEYGDSDAVDLEE